MFAKDFLLERIITQPTRGTYILDPSFTSHSSTIHQYKIVPGLNDHDAIIIGSIIYHLSDISYGTDLMQRCTRE